MLVKYNGVALPALPTDVNIDEYPYRFIRYNKTSDYWDLCISTQELYYNNSTSKLVVSVSPCTERHYQIQRNSISDTAAWLYIEQYTDEPWNITSDRTLIWSSFDIPNGSPASTDIYYQGSEPVPITHIYTSIGEIVASVENATQLRTNSKNDDGTDTVNCPEWVTYKGNVCRAIVASGNSWLGFGKESEDLKVNRRDTAMWNLWREEGAVNGKKFFRVRWGGYSKYNTTNSAWKLTYDVILLETGDIQLYMVDIPTQDYNGAFSLDGVNYNAPSTARRYVAFYKDGNGYKTKYEEISVISYKYLVRNDSVIYTVVDDSLQEVEGELTAELFQTYGGDDIPAGTLLIPLSAPEVLCWANAEDVPQLTATVQGAPTGAHSIISDDINIGHESISGIKSVEVTASDRTTFLLSFDGGSWMVYDTISNTWIASNEGMNTADFLAIPINAWTSLINDAQNMKLKATLDGVDTVTEVRFNFENKG